MKEKINITDYADIITKALPKGILLNTMGDKFNSMVIGWGHLGTLWSLPTFVVYVRQSRYTKGQLDKTGEFTVSVPLDGTIPSIHTICGTKSGFDIDKDKLVSILQQDRQRYNEAYLKGYKDRDGEIVRCRDCKWWDKKDESDYGYCHACKHGYSSPHWEIGIYRTYKGNWYCADGEREDEDEEEDIQTDEE